MPCPMCVGWNFPLTQKQFVSPTGIASPMSFRDWIVFTLHIVHHQGPQHWGGELHAVQALLWSDPAFSLVSGPTPDGFPQPV